MLRALNACWGSELEALYILDQVLSKTDSIKTANPSVPNGRIVTTTPRTLLHLRLARRTTTPVRRKSVTVNRHSEQGTSPGGNFSRLLQSPAPQRPRKRWSKKPSFPLRRTQQQDRRASADNTSEEPSSGIQRRAHPIPSCRGSNHSRRQHPWSRCRLDCLEKRRTAATGPWS